MVLIMLTVIKIVICIFAFIISTVKADEYILAPPQSSFDSSHDYYYQLLKLGLYKAGHDKDSKLIKFHNQVLTQNRAISELINDSNRITIHRMGTSMEREEKLLPIRVPLVRGILGYRIFIIRRDMETVFSSIKTLLELQKLKACQGSHWPDTTILRNAGLKVVDSPNYEAMFKMLSAGRCDYFPRAIHEGVVELKARELSYPDLMIEKTLMLSYMFPMYFFVNKKDYRMAYQVEKGLLLAIKDKSFDEFMQTHPTTAHIFPLSKWSKRTIFDLDNPLLPESTPLENRTLWFGLNQ